MTHFYGVLGTSGLPFDYQFLAKCLDEITSARHENLDIKSFWLKYT